MRASICLFASDLADEGLDAVLGNVRDRAGLDAVSVACNYHHARDVFPHGRRGKVRYSDAEVHVRPRPARYGLLRPAVSALAAERDPVGELVDRAAARSLAVRGWMNVTHNSRIGSEHPQCAVRNVFGDRLRSNLCPANPEVRHYVRALVGDVARYGLDTIFAESVGYLPFDHGDHHERCHVPLGPVARYLLGLCLCSHCCRYAAEEGVAVDRVRAELAATLERCLAGEPTELDEVALTPDGVGGLAGGELAGLLRARTRVVTSLAAELTEAARSEAGVPFVFMDMSGAFQAAGAGTRAGVSDGPAVRRAWQDGVDIAAVVAAAAGLAGLGYVEGEQRFAAEVAAYREQVPPAKELAIALRPMDPDCASPDNLRAKVDHARRAGVDWLELYHYGFMPLARLDWIAAALRTAR